MSVMPQRAERDFRGPGCTAACRVERIFRPGAFGRFELLLHDATSHEDYGAWMAAPDGRRSPHVVATGPLEIDLARTEVRLDGEPAGLTPIETSLLMALAREVGATVRQSELLDAVWGEDRLLGGEADGHLLRANVGRMRSRLGRAGNLLVTVPGFGYRLEEIPAGAPPPARRQGQRSNPVTGWSQAYLCCRGCGTTRAPHGGRGYCAACLTRSRRLRVEEVSP